MIKGHGESYSNAKAGKAWGAAAPDYDDSKWRELDLPHDWVVEGPFDEKENLSQGYRPRGVGWYRRHFKLPAGDRGRHIELQFDGVATHCTVWVNGIVAHRNWCGYTSFPMDITPFAQFGEGVNTIAVRVDANAMEGWWYEGAWHLSPHLAGEARCRPHRHRRRVCQSRPRRPMASGCCRSR